MNLDRLTFGVESKSISNNILEGGNSERLVGEDNSAEIYKFGSQISFDIKLDRWDVKSEIEEISRSNFL
jgi:hypothetical protein